MPDLAANRWTFCQPENHVSTSFLGGMGVNFIKNATSIILEVEIRIVSFATNLTRVLALEIRVMNVSHNSDLGKRDFVRNATRIRGQSKIWVENFQIVQLGFWK